MSHEFLRTYVPLYSLRLRLTNCNNHKTIIVIIRQDVCQKLQNLTTSRFTYIFIGQQHNFESKILIFRNIVLSYYPALTVTQIVQKQKTEKAKQLLKSCVFSRDKSVEGLYEEDITYRESVKKQLFNVTCIWWNTNRSKPELRAWHDVSLRVCHYLCLQEC